jgi:hypothetical protein
MGGLNLASESARASLTLTGAAKTVVSGMHRRIDHGRNLM